MKIITQNRKAFHDYEIVDRIEAGIVLSGDEVKSIRAGHINLTGSFAQMVNSELWLKNCHITPYKQAYDLIHKDEEYPVRNRKLLLSRRELKRINNDIARQGITVVPLKVYFTSKNFIKVELGIAKGKKSADKRQALKERDIKRQTDREMRIKY